jgi:hypothetical protein
VVIAAAHAQRLGREHREISGDTGNLRAGKLLRSSQVS